MSKLYVLEVNAGGNTWHFSSSLAKDTRVSLGRHKDPNHPFPAFLGGQILESQFGAFDLVAQRLVEVTNEMVQ